MAQLGFIGRTMGPFTGHSVLSDIEIVYFASKFLKSMFFKPHLKLCFKYPEKVGISPTFSVKISSWQFVSNIKDKYKDKDRGIHKNKWKTKTHLEFDMPSAIGLAYIQIP